MSVRLGGSVAALVHSCWCGAWAEGALLVSWGGSWTASLQPGVRAEPFCSGVCLVRSFGCLKHLSNTLGTAH